MFIPFIGKLLFVFSFVSSHSFHLALTGATDLAFTITVINDFVSFSLAFRISKLSAPRL